VSRKTSGFEDAAQCGAITWHCGGKGWGHRNGPDDALQYHEAIHSGIGCRGELWLLQIGIGLELH
jgi:hypothetical protein